MFTRREIFTQQKLGDALEHGVLPQKLINRHVATFHVETTVYLQAYFPTTRGIQAAGPVDPTENQGKNQGKTVALADETTISYDFMIIHLK